MYVGIINVVLENHVRRALVTAEPVSRVVMVCVLEAKHVHPVQRIVACVRIVIMVFVMKGKIICLVQMTVPHRLGLVVEIIFVIQMKTVALVQMIVEDVQHLRVEMDSVVQILENLVQAVKLIVGHVFFHLIPLLRQVQQHPL